MEFNFEQQITTKPDEFGYWTVLSVEVCRLGPADWSFGIAPMSIRVDGDYFLEGYATSESRVKSFATEAAIWYLTKYRQHEVESISKWRKPG